MVICLPSNSIDWSLVAELNREINSETEDIVVSIDPSIEKAAPLPSFTKVDTNSLVGNYHEGYKEEQS